jgi:hypothetical protein
VLSHLHLDNRWKDLVITALRGEKKVEDNTEQRNRLLAALENLRKQHLWGHITDEDYRHDRATLERQLKEATPNSEVTVLPNLERAAQLLNDLPALWSHEGVTNKQREALVQEVFNKITIDGGTLASIEPKPAYAPLFATVLLQNPIGYCDLKPS